jgi:hypothetical protein
MEQRPSWEANRSSASQEIPRILRTIMIIYCIHNSPPTAPVLSQIDPVYAPPSHLSKIRFNIILPSLPSDLPAGFPTENLYAPLLSLVRASFSTHFGLFVWFVTWLSFYGKELLA